MEEIMSPLPKIARASVRLKKKKILNLIENSNAKFTTNRVYI